MILFNKKNISTETPVSVERESSLFLKCFLVLSFFLLNQQLKSQVIEWQRTYHPEDNAKALDEDWFYDIKPSHSGTSGPQDGYIAVGYAGSGVVAISPPAALASVEYDELHTSIRKKGASHQLLTKLDLSGNVMWYVESSRSEFLSKVIQTSDGNYVVAGTTTTGITKYNPISTNTTGTTISSTPVKKRGYLAKYNTSGTLLWEYTYGLADYVSDSTNAVNSSMQLWDLVETDDGGIMAVGFDEEYNNYYVRIQPESNSVANLHQTYNRIALIKTDADGILSWKQDYGPANKDCKAYGIDRQGTNYVICGGALHQNVGYDVNISLSDYYSYSLVYVMSFTGSSAAPNPSSAYAREAYLSVHNVNGEKDIATNVTFDNGGNIILPAIVEASVGYFDAHGLGKGKIYKLTFSDLSTVSTYSLTGLTLCAYDLKAGVCATSDGGFAITTSIKSPYYSDLSSLDIPDPNASGGYHTLANDGTNDMRFWNNDVYVAKFNSSMTKQWERTIDNRTNSAEYGTEWPADVRRAECVYDINQTEDGGFIIGGNNSANYDDEYAIKIKVSCALGLSPDISGHEITGTETITGTHLANGTFTIQNGGVLNINNATISFTDTRQYKDKYEIADPSSTYTNPTTIIVQPGGRLNVNNSTLQASSNCAYMWDGIQVIGNPDIGQGSSDDQGVVYISNNSIIKEARYAVLLGSIDYDSPIEDLPLYNVEFKNGGGIVDAVNSSFVNNYISIFSTSYRGDTKSVQLRSCIFNNNALLKDPLFATVGNERIGIKYFVNLFNTKMATIRGCTFEGYTTLADDKRGVAIVSNKSGLKVEDYYSGIIVAFTSRPTGTPTLIQEMTKGIDAYGLGSIYDKVIVRNSYFKNNLRGISTDYSDFIDIRSNNFEVPTTTSDINPCAIFHHIGTAANIQNNTISGDGVSDYGIITRHTYEEFLTYIGYNSIDGNKISFQTEGNNFNLHTKCNGFYNMEKGMDINPASPSPYGKLANQGDGSGTGSNQPLNLFDADASLHIISTIDFLYYNNTSNPLPALATKVVFPTSTDLITYLSGFKLCTYSDPSIEYSTKYHLIAYSDDAPYAERRTELDYIHALLYEGYDADVLEILDSMHYIGADKILLNTFIEEGEYTKAQDKIDALVIKNLQDDENINYLSLSQWWLDYLQNGGTMNHLEDSMKLALNDFKDTTIASSGLADVICIDANTPLLIHIPEKGNNYEERKSNQSALLASKINEVPNQLSVFPNPTCNILTIKYPFIIDKFVNLTLYNNTGEQVLSRRTENTGSMDLNMLDYQLKDGNYLVKIASSDAFYTASFIKFSY